MQLLLKVFVSTDRRQCHRMNGLVNSCVLLQVQPFCMHGHEANACFSKVFFAVDPFSGLAQVEGQSFHACSKPILPVWAKAYESADSI